MTALPYVLHGTTLALAWFLIFNIAVTIAVARLSPRLIARAGVASSGFWLAVRLAPAALAVAFVAVVFLPSYWRYEPREFVEGFDVSLTALAALALVTLAAAAWRGAAAWLAASRRTAAWMRAAQPLTLAGNALPAYLIDAEAPVMALVGVLRPRLLITRPVLAALTAEELGAAAAHELGHRRAFDNLKRLAMCAAPDLLRVTAAAHALEQRWAAASEHAADRGAGQSGAARCALASALVKVARLTPPSVPLAEPISALLDGGDITARVHRLLDEGSSVTPRRPSRWLILSIPVAALVLGYAPLLRLVHGVTEIFVNGLP